MQQTDVQALQVSQHQHDLQNHFDIVALHRADRIKHYGLHFAKYAGRLARGELEQKALEATLADALLVALSAANALNQRLQAAPFWHQHDNEQASLARFVDASGRFADACEKTDHLEEYRAIALDANEDIVSWILKKAKESHIDLIEIVEARRAQLRLRQVYNQQG
jgi:hypothetical protein